MKWFGLDFQGGADCFLLQGERLDKKLNAFGYDLKSKEPGSKQGSRHPDDPGVEEGQLGGVDVSPGEARVH